MWRLSVWLGAMLHHAEDAGLTLHAVMQFLTYGAIQEASRQGGAWLDEQTNAGVDPDGVLAWPWQLP